MAENRIIGKVYIWLFIENGEIKVCKTNDIPEDVDTMAMIIFNFIIKSYNFMKGITPIRYKIKIIRHGGFYCFEGYLARNIDINDKKGLLNKLIEDCLLLMEANNIQIKKNILT